MAQATVFVDDAVLGRLPPICVKDGVHTADTLTLRSRVGDGTGLGVLWLLVLAGPLGWLGLFLFAVMRRPADTLTVQLPFSEAAYERFRWARRESWFFGAVVLVLLLAALVVADHSGLLAVLMTAVAVLAVVPWGMALHRMRSCSVVVDLDASRRWVTLSRVHQAFAESCWRGPQPPAALDTWSRNA